MKSKLAVLEIKVGVFIFLLLVLSAAVIFLLGRKSNLFEEQVELRTSFKSASGLRVGAQVRLAGVQVGQVSQIHFAKDPRDQNVIVELKIRKEVLPRVTDKSRARIDSMGLLGDKIIDISVGVTGDPVEPGTMLEGKAPPEYLQLLDIAQGALTDVRAITQRLNKVITLYGDPQLYEDIKQTVRGIRQIVGQVEGGKGLAHSLLYDQRLARDLRALFHGVGKTAQRLGSAGRAFALAFNELGKILQQVRTTPGTTAHALIYGKDQVTKVLEAAGRASEGLVEVIQDAKALMTRAKEGKGLLSELMTGTSGREILENLAAASQTIRQLLASVQSGQGTLGGLLADPTIYEDLKKVVGNLERNRILRALIRFAIHKKETAAPKVREAPAEGRSALEKAP
jgi:phospholipid/cholesterol/gamma-HCH transport system substrate-binding protein